MARWLGGRLDEVVEVNIINRVELFESFCAKIPYTLIEMRGR